MTRSGGKAVGLYGSEELKQIADTVISADLNYSPSLRVNLLKHISPDFVSRIPAVQPPQQQLVIDLRYLNNSGRLPDGSHPISLWLEQVVGLLKNKPQAKDLQIIAKKVQRRGARQAPRAR